MIKNTKAAILNALSEMKAHNVNDLDVTQLTTITDYMIIATGTSTRHVKAIADAVITESKKLDFAPIGVEGEHDAEWILIDLGEIVVHVMLPGTREFYNLEKLWTVFDADEAIPA